ncbi:hypothetical protein [Mucilaginibacter flavus]|uniref:hypothetical protein n=1 Tax=Mucilaginibacter flavus TaxID=931504 RepID=UPI0025B458E9|nr:hypothetical protein [Mucilaginibacter flavus]MDN3584502.1 hypothetical protein [Mucilaginibacter flavus]
MLLKNLNLTDGNHFVAMEYHTLILNRTYLVIITKDFLLGLKVNNAISAEGGHNPLAIAVSRALAVKGDLNNPFSYVKNKYLQPLLDQDIYSDAILQNDKANFKIYKRDITEVTYDNSKKWGMGNYPHDGKVYVKTADNKKREFIILGDQSGKHIADWILRS